MLRVHEDCMNNLFQIIFKIYLLPVPILVPNNGAMNSETSAVMTRMPARFSQKPAFITCGSRTSLVPNTIAFGGVPTGIM